MELALIDPTFRANIGEDNALCDNLYVVISRLISCLNSCSKYGKSVKQVIHTQRLSLSAKWNESNPKESKVFIDTVAAKTVSSPAHTPQQSLRGLDYQDPYSDEDDSPKRQ